MSARVCTTRGGITSQSPISKHNHTSALSVAFQRSSGKGSGWDTLNCFRQLYPSSLALASDRRGIERQRDSTPHLHPRERYRQNRAISCIACIACMGGDGIYHGTITPLLLSSCYLFLCHCELAFICQSSYFKFAVGSYITSMLSLV